MVVMQEVSVTTAFYHKMNRDGIVFFNMVFCDYAEDNTERFESFPIAVPCIVCHIFIYFHLM